MKTHIQTAHEKSKPPAPIECPECNKSVKNTGILNTILMKQRNINVNSVQKLLKSHLILGGTSKQFTKVNQFYVTSAINH